MYKTPFSDKVGLDSVPKRGTSGGQYDSQEVPNTPSRDVSPNGVAELHRDTAASSGSPSTSGLYKTQFNDAVGK